jgi:hypothetical protein
MSFVGTVHLNSAFIHFSNAAIVGHKEAQNFLGYMYQNGKGVKMDYQDAVIGTRRLWIKIYLRLNFF